MSDPATLAQMQAFINAQRGKVAAADDDSFINASLLRGHHLEVWSEGYGSLVGRRVNNVQNPMELKWPAMNFLNPDENVRGHIILNDSKQAQRAPEIAEGCTRANACRRIWWEPSKVKAAIVTCGGLCPGLNSIIREVTNCLWFNYGVKDILGMTGGFHGLSEPENYPTRQLNPEWVRDIHMQGGSVLQCGRGGFDATKIADNLEKLGINHVYVVGGDGTQSAGNLLFEEVLKRKLSVSVVGVPKSIDNDVLFFDRTFGFDSAVACASDIIRNAWTEARSCFKGVGIVKLMGRDAGFVAMNASRASTIVDLCLIPEVDFELGDCLAHISSVVARKGYCVVVVAEGAGQNFVATGEVDSTGHAKYGDIGIFLRDAVNKHLKEEGGRSFYIDPSYIIRSCATVPNDHIYCSRLANDAVHTAMRGFSGVCVGAIHNIVTILPSKLIATGKKRVKPSSSEWQSCVQSCKMPSSLSGLSKIGEPPLKKAKH